MKKTKFTTYEFEGEADGRPFRIEYKINESKDDEVQSFVEVKFLDGKGGGFKANAKLLDQVFEAMRDADPFADL